MMGLRMKNYGDSLKNPIFRERFTKNQCIERKCLKRGGGALTVCRFRGGECLAKKRGGVFLKGVDTSLHTMKPNALLHKTHIEVLRLDMCTSIISLSKIADQIWRDHPFSQRNKTTE